MSFLCVVIKTNTFLPTQWQRIPLNAADQRAKALHHPRRLRSPVSSMTWRRKVPPNSEAQQEENLSIDVEDEISDAACYKTLRPLPDEKVLKEGGVDKQHSLPQNLWRNKHLAQIKFRGLSCCRRQKAIWVVTNFRFQCLPSLLPRACSKINPRVTCEAALSKKLSIWQRASHSGTATCSRALPWMQLWFWGFFFSSHLGLLCFRFFSQSYCSKSWLVRATAEQEHTFILSSLCQKNSLKSWSRRKTSFLPSHSHHQPMMQKKKKKDYIQQQGVQGLCHLCDIRRVWIGVSDSWVQSWQKSQVWMGRT